MDAKNFAVLVSAQPMGRGRYKARCPAHADKSPSLSIRTGHDGRVLVNCFAGCSIDSILAALKLAKRDLFCGPPPSPDQLAEIRAEQERREAEWRRLAVERREARDKLERIQLIVNSLGAKLTRTPDDDKVANAFHLACEMLHKAGQVLEGIKHSAEAQGAV